MGIACSTNGERNACRILVRKPEGKGLLGRQRRRWVFNTKMNVRDVEWGDIDWIYLTQGPAENSCEQGNELSGSIKF
jgi:hypothetical protein